MAFLLIGAPHFHVASRKSRGSSGKPQCPAKIWWLSHLSHLKNRKPQNHHPIYIYTHVIHVIYVIHFYAQQGGKNMLKPPTTQRKTLSFWVPAVKIPPVRLIVVVETPGTTVAEPVTVGGSWRLPVKSNFLGG